MANFALVLGVSQGVAKVIGQPSDLSGAKKRFTSVVMDGGVANGASFDEVWLCDTVQGRLRRKAFCHTAAQAPEPAKKTKA
jgi:hypothetical protein